MPLYYFNLNHRDGISPDCDGSDLPDEPSARAHAGAVVCELMRNREAQRRSWRLQVCDAQHAPLFEVLFADLDASLDHLSPELRASMRDVSLKAGDMRDRIRDVRATLHQLNGTLARADGLPWLAAMDGRRL
jgi:uncharacterized protein DUF6894